MMSLYSLEPSPSSSADLCCSYQSTEFKVMAIVQIVPPGYGAAMICGVDEAGRGPVIGPLVVAAVMVEDDAVLRSLRVKDSKQLTPSKREELAREIRERARVEVEVIEAAQLDQMMALESLNDIEVKAFASLIASLRAEVVYADACDVSPKASTGRGERARPSPTTMLACRMLRTLELTH